MCVCVCPRAGIFVTLQLQGVVNVTTLVVVSCSGQAIVKVFPAVAGASGVGWIGPFGAADPSATCYPVGAMSAVGSQSVVAGCSDGSVQKFDVPGFTTTFWTSGATAISTYPAVFADDRS